MYQLNNYFNIRIYIIPIWFYFNGISLTVSISASIFTFQYGSTLIRSLSPPEIVENTALHTIVDLFAFLFYRTSTEFFIINLHHLQIQFYNIPFHHIDIAYAIVFIIKYNFIILGLYLFFYFLHLFTDLLYTLIVSVFPHWNFSLPKLNRYLYL